LRHLNRYNRCIGVCSRLFDAIVDNYRQRGRVHTFRICLNS